MTVMSFEYLLIATDPVTDTKKCRLQMKQRTVGDPINHIYEDYQRLYIWAER